MRSQTSRSEMLGLATAFAVSAALLYGISRFSPWISPDTGGYLDPPPLPEGWAGPRHPAFGWILGALPGPGFWLVPPLHVLLFFGATALLYGAMRAYGTSVRAAASCVAALLGSNLLLLWHNAVHPEMLSVVLAISALAFAIRAAAERHALLNGALAALALGAASILRPTFLPAIVLLPALYAGLAHWRGGGPRILFGAALLGLACATPFLVNSAIRYRAVGDFNIVSFGGFQMSGMAALMLSPEIVAALPEDVRQLGAAILEGREKAERDGTVLATPMNSSGERSFVSAALGYYDIYARTYDSLLYGPVASLQGTQPWVAWNARLMRFSLAVVRAAPGRYAAWVVGGTARVVGRALVVDLAFVVALAGSALLFGLALWRRRLSVVEAAAPADIPVLILLTAVYAVSAGALTVLTTFPASRYIDTVALFLPALPIYGCLSLVAALRWPSG